ncbi:hypothetical protein SARC_06320 [Sphaeroforma arctica JP610]|uniref:Biogenesis of lysosome-related organelles complex 1 subunit 1 n=1 Tax=Sphaeroforma arctica JP610 TaxID=667725 RepID=A0A0L0FXQ4_9EUKA|nr:hypothetical protein SARC_06320 [Sphaeroforma arctica JP610]KNC81346.1 hypothetical protein SARC_06320 [Sphaeroforma arctica JP610]|eukprot:XP_014155248.1 hypothetical protein SARC_06320 [Sphaeroforma arctica JP610]
MWHTLRLNALLIASSYTTARVAEIFANQRELEKQTKLLTQHTEVLSKETDQWQNMVESFNDALKEIGDVENWARVMENDLKIIADVVKQVNKEPEPEEELSE